MAEQTELELALIQRNADEAATRTPNRMAELSAAIRRTAGAETDPYIVMGLLIEGVSDTLAVRTPPIRQDDVAQALAHMLLDPPNV